MTTISIIVPIYNQEKVMRKCLDSILKQTFSDWECILVDDGSTDLSGEVCDEYVRIDHRFKVLHKNNEGVAMARQSGVDKANGVYIIHVDSDDYIEPTMLKEMYEAIMKQKVDILVCDYIMDDFSGKTSYQKQEPSDTSIKGLLSDILHDKLHGALWNKLVKRDCYVKYKAKFFRGLNYAEDVLIWAQISDSNMHVGYLPKAYYHYVANETSITHVVTTDLFRIQKDYITKLSSFGVEKSLVLAAAHRIKLNALRSGVLTKKDFYEFYTPDIATIKERKEPANFLFGFLAYNKLFYLGVFAYKLVHFLQSSSMYKSLRSRIN